MNQPTKVTKNKRLSKLSQSESRLVCFFAMVTYTVCFKYQFKDVVYYWSDKVVTSREFTTYDNKKCLPLAHFTASTATDCH